jgi:hypothetical protein
MSDVLVNVENVSKRFCRSLKRSLWNGLRDLGSADVQLRPDEFLTPHSQRLVPPAEFAAVEEAVQAVHIQGGAQIAKASP